MENWIFEAVIGMIRGWLFKSAKAAKFAKYCLRIRDYLLLLFPLEMYPENGTADPVLESGVDVTPVPVAEVKKAAKEFKFNIPFVKGR